MAPALLRSWKTDEPRLLRRRATAMIITLVAHLLLLYLLLRLAPQQFAPIQRAGSLKTFSVMPSEEARESQPKAARAARATARRTPAAPPPAPIPPPVPVTTPPRQLTGIIELSRDEMRTLSTAMTTPNTAGPPAAVSGGGDGRGDTPSQMGPRGELLYAAEWYREPTRAEMDTYLPRSVNPPVSGMIACQTVARFHVDNCYELGDSRPGAGIARAMRQAAFQFLVRPPRVGGKSLVGTWVRIEYTLLPAKADTPDNGD